MKCILVGTRNVIRKETLKDLTINIICLDDLEIKINAIEDGRNPIENSLKKALTYRCEEFSVDEHLKYIKLKNVSLS